MGVERARGGNNREIIMGTVLGSGSEKKRSSGLRTTGEKKGKAENGDMEMVHW